MSAAISLPALRLGRGRLGTLRRPEQLRNCAETALRSRFFEDYLLIDAEEYRHDLESAHKLRYKPPFWGFRLTRSRLIEVELRFRTPSKLTMGAVIPLVVAALRRQADSWSAGSTLRELENAMRAAPP